MYNELFFSLYTIPFSQNSPSAGDNVNSCVYQQSIYISATVIIPLFLNRGGLLTPNHMEGTSTFRYQGIARSGYGQACYGTQNSGSFKVFIIISFQVLLANNYELKIWINYEIPLLNIRSMFVKLLSRRCYYPGKILLPYPG